MGLWRANKHRSQEQNVSTLSWSHQAPERKAWLSGGYDKLVTTVSCNKGMVTISRNRQYRMI